LANRQLNLSHFKTEDMLFIVVLLLSVLIVSIIEVLKRKI